MRNIACTLVLFISFITSSFAPAAKADRKLAAPKTNLVYVVVELYRYGLPHAAEITVEKINCEYDFTSAAQKLQTNQYGQLYFYAEPGFSYQFWYKGNCEAAWTCKTFYEWDNYHWFEVENRSHECHK